VWRQQQDDRERSDHWEEHGLIFTDQQGQPIDGTTLGHAFKKIARAANLPPHATIDDYRHTCLNVDLARRPAATGSRERPRCENFRRMFEEAGRGLGKIRVEADQPFPYAR
jgi:hypothetical protein